MLRQSEKNIKLLCRSNPIKARHSFQKVERLCLPRLAHWPPALGMSVDASVGAAPIREKGLAPPPVQPHDGTTFKKPPPKKLFDVVMTSVCSEDDSGYDSSNSEVPQMRNEAAVQAAAGSLAAALGMNVDKSFASAPIRERGRSAPPVQPHLGTIFIGKSRTGNDSVSLEVTEATPGSLAAALGMSIDPSSGSAPIREDGHVPVENFCTIELIQINDILI
jgi:hypothetical protein